MSALVCHGPCASDGDWSVQHDRIALLVSKQHGTAQQYTPTARHLPHAALQVYRHIVLAVHHLPSGRYGALGLSRRSELMYKPLRFSSLAELVGDFRAGYEHWWHQLLKVSSLGCQADVMALGRL